MSKVQQNESRNNHKCIIWMKKLDHNTRVGLHALTVTLL